jgi:hypothetical protein
MLNCPAIFAEGIGAQPSARKSAWSPTPDRSGPWVPAIAGSTGAALARLTQHSLGPGRPHGARYTVPKMSTAESPARFGKSSQGTPWRTNSKTDNATAPGVVAASSIRYCFTRGIKDLQARPIVPAIGVVSTPLMQSRSFVAPGLPHLGPQKVHIVALRRVSERATGRSLKRCDLHVCVLDDVSWTAGR